MAKAKDTNYQIMYPNGQVDNLTRDTDFKLKEMQDIVGGYIEIVYGLPNDRIMIVDDEGLLKHKPWNLNASVACGGRIAGVAIVCPNWMVK